MNPKHITHIVLVVACLTGLLITAPAPAQAQTTFDCSAVTEIPQSECQALVALYNATGGENWYNHTGWLQTTTPCSWRGVACDASHVTQLNMNGNNLNGLLPSEIGNLATLNTFDLGCHDEHLPRPFFARNHLTALPPEFGNLTNLTFLNLSENDLTTLPPEFGNLSNLTKLYLMDNDLNTLPPEFGNLNNLTTLYLNRNNMETLPPEFGDLVNLTQLYLGGDNLKALPPEFGNLSNLTRLNIANSWLTSLPPEFGNLSNLTELYLPYNNLNTLPPEFGNLSNLTSLNIDSNLLTSLPPEFYNLTNLTSLTLRDNPLQGAIPTSLANLTHLQYFDYRATEWCSPAAGPVHEWLRNISEVIGNDLVCNNPVAGLNFQPIPELTAHNNALFIITLQPEEAAVPITYTWDIGATSPITHVRGTLTDTAWLYWDTPGAHTLTVTAANEINTLSITRTVFVQPISSTLILPDAPARLTYTDTQGLPTTLDLPAGSVTQTAALLYRPQPDPAIIPAWRSAGHAFSLNLYREGRALPNPTFTHPLTLTLHYSEADIANVDRPADLQLMRRDAGGWQLAACGPVSNDLEQRALTVPLCQLGEFALFGPATLTKFVEPAGFIENGDALTYTLVFSNPDGGALRLFDPISPTLAWQGFVSPPPGDIVFAGGALSGTLSLSPTHPLTLSFTVHVTLPQTATAPLPTAVANTAFFCWAQHTACIFQPSNTVSNPLIATRLFLPLLLRTP